MNLSKFSTILILCGAFGGGLVAGLLAQQGQPLRSGLAVERGLSAPSGSKATGQPVGGGGSEDFGAGGEPATFPANRSEQESFGGFDLQKQVDILRRLASSEGRGFRASGLALLAKIMPQLSADQAATLLGEVPGGRLEDGEIRRFLAERLAELDAPRALELGKKLGDTKLLGSILSVMGEEDSAKALAVAGTLPLEQGKEVLSFYLQQALGGGMKGSAAEVAAVLKDMPALKELGINGVFGVPEFIGGLLAKAGDMDPASVLAAVRGLSTELSALKKDATDHAADENALGQAILRGVLNELRSKDPQAAAVFFDALPDSAKSQWMFPEEANARFKSGGVEAAVSFAEKQVVEEFVKRAASGVWWGLAQQDRPGAFAWIESLPPGAFRSGVLNAVMWDAWNQSMSWGRDGVAIEAGAHLLSKKSQMDYYVSLMSDRRFGGRGSSPSELIAQLPISEEDKRKLYGLIAPIK